MVSYICGNREWEYTNNMQHKLTILSLGGSCKAILQLPVMEGKKMLGARSSPAGLDTKHLQEVVLGKTSKWVGRLKNAHLPTHLAWKAYQYQLWPSIRYGIATLTTPRKEIEEISLSSKCFPTWESTNTKNLMEETTKGVWRCWPLQCVNRTIHQLDGGPTAILWHWLSTSKKLQASLEAMQLELGFSGNPLN